MQNRKTFSSKKWQANIKEIFSSIIMPRILDYMKEYIGITSLIGCGAGTAVSYWSVLIGKGIYNLIFEKIPYILENGDPYILLYQPNADAWALAGKAAFAGGIFGAIAAVRMKKFILRALKRG